MTEFVPFISPTSIMSDLFHVHSNVKQADCDRFAEDFLQGPVSPMIWQGYWSYTVVSRDGLTIIQFRAAESPLDQDIVNLAHQIHPQLVPETIHLGSLGNSDVSIWKMDRIIGKGFGVIVTEDGIQQKLPATMVDMAKFYAAAWKCPQSPTEERVSTLRQECQTKLSQLESVLPDALQPYITQSRDALDDITQLLPWVLTHGDLSDMNILVDADTGHLQGIVDWAEARISPFGMALWGLESVLGFSNDSGWHWLENESHSHRELFSKTFQEDVGDALSGRYHLLEKARILGLLLRYGLVWQADGSFVPEKDTSQLTVLLPCTIFPA